MKFKTQEPAPGYITELNFSIQKVSCNVIPCFTHAGDLYVYVNFMNKKCSTKKFKADFPLIINETFVFRKHYQLSERNKLLNYLKDAKLVMELRQMLCRDKCRVLAANEVPCKEFLLLSKFENLQVSGKIPLSKLTAFFKDVCVPWVHFQARLRFLREVPDLCYSVPNCSSENEVDKPEAERFDIGGTSDRTHQEHSKNCFQQKTCLRPSSAVNCDEKLKKTLVSDMYDRQLDGHKTCRCNSEHKNLALSSARQDLLRCLLRSRHRMDNPMWNNMGDGVCCGDQFRQDACNSIGSDSETFLEDSVIHPGVPRGRDTCHVDFEPIPSYDQTIEAPTSKADKSCQQVETADMVTQCEDDTKKDKANVVPVIKFLLENSTEEMEIKYPRPSHGQGGPIIQLCQGFPGAFPIISDMISVSCASVPPNKPDGSTVGTDKPFKPASYPNTNTKRTSIGDPKTSAQGHEKDTLNRGQNDTPNRGQNGTSKWDQTDTPMEGQNDTPKRGQNDTPKRNQNDTQKWGQNGTSKWDQNDTPMEGQNDTPKWDQNDTRKWDQNGTPKRGQNDTPKWDHNDTRKWDQNDTPKRNQNDTQKWGQNGTAKWDQNDTPMEGQNDTPKWDQNDTPMEGQNDTPKWDQNGTPKRGQNDTPKWDQNDTPKRNQNATQKWGQNGTSKWDQNDTPMEGQNDTPKWDQNDTRKWDQNGTPKRGQNDTSKWGQNDTPRWGQNDTPKRGQNDTPKRGQNDTPKRSQNSTSKWNQTSTSKWDQNDTRKWDQNDTPKRGQNDTLKRNQNDTSKSNQISTSKWDQNDTPKRGQNDAPRRNQKDTPKRSQNDTPKWRQNDTPKWDKKDTRKWSLNGTPKWGQNDTPKRSQNGISKWDQNDTPKWGKNDTPKWDQNDTRKWDQNDARKWDQNDTPKRGLNDTPKWAQNDTPQKGPNDTPKRSQNDTPKRSQNSTSKWDQNDTPKWDQNDTPKKGQNDTPQRGQTNTPQRVQNDTPKRGQNVTPNWGQNDTPKWDQNDTPKRAQNLAPEKGQSGVPKDNQNDVPKDGQSASEQHPVGNSPFVEATSVISGITSHENTEKRRIKLASLRLSRNVSETTSRKFKSALLDTWQSAVMRRNVGESGESSIVQRVLHDNQSSVKSLYARDLMVSSEQPSAVPSGLLDTTSQSRFDAKLGSEPPKLKSSLAKRSRQDHTSSTKRAHIKEIRHDVQGVSREIPRLKDLNRDSKYSSKRAETHQTLTGGSSTAPGDSLDSDVKPQRKEQKRQKSAELETPPKVKATRYKRVPATIPNRKLKRYRVPGRIPSGMSSNESGYRYRKSGTSRSRRIRKFVPRKREYDVACRVSSNQWPSQAPKSSNLSGKVLENTWDVSSNIPETMTRSTSTSMIPVSEVRGIDLKISQNFSPSEVLESSISLNTGNDGSRRCQSTTTQTSNYLPLNFRGTHKVGSTLNLQVVTTLASLNTSKDGKVHSVRAGHRYVSKMTVAKRDKKRLIATTSQSTGQSIARPQMGGKRINMVHGDNKRKSSSKLKFQRRTSGFNKKDGVRERLLQPLDSPTEDTISSDDQNNPSGALGLKTFRCQQNEMKQDHAYGWDSNSLDTGATGYETQRSNSRWPSRKSECQAKVVSLSPKLKILDPTLSRSKRNSREEENKERIRFVLDLNECTDWVDEKSSETCVSYQLLSKEDNLTDDKGTADEKENNSNQKCRDMIDKARGIIHLGERGRSLLFKGNPNVSKSGVKGGCDRMVKPPGSRNPTGGVFSRKRTESIFTMRPFAGFHSMLYPERLEVEYAVCTPGCMCVSVMIGAFLIKMFLLTSLEVVTW